MLSDKRVPPVKRLRAHFEFMAFRYEGFGFGKGCLIGNLAAEMSENTPLLRKALAQSLKRWTELVAAAIRDGQADGSIAAGLDAPWVARLLINSWGGSVVGLKIVDTPAPLGGFFSLPFPLFA